MIKVKFVKKANMWCKITIGKFKFKEAKGTGFWRWTHEQKQEWFSTKREALA